MDSHLIRYGPNGRYIERVEFNDRQKALNDNVKVAIN